MEKEYAFYRGEEILATGTIAEIARTVGVKVETIKWYKYPSSKKRSTYSSLVPLDDEEDVS
ncbi:hypothetical protein [Salinicoccus halodurans]|nr:hypothetical protein [Salinicoccus halodurans]SFK95291.1 hypothetical protein SAMN05216235_2731 [Salinicoccus halodurans]